jgi:hypothetical protein
MFYPLPAFDAVGPMSQTRIRRLPGAPILQSAIPRSAAWSPLESRVLISVDQSAHAATEAASGLPTETVASELLLVLRNDAGGVVDTDRIVIMELTLPPGPTGEAMVADLARQGKDFTGFTLHVRLAEAATGAA